MKFLGASLTVVLLLTAGLAQKEAFAQTPEPMGTTPVASEPVIASGDRDSVLGVGDIVSFAIQEDQDAPLKLRVTDTGELDIPYAGRITAAGKTCGAVAGEAKRKLEAKYYYTATVKLGIEQKNKASSLAKIYVSGYVKLPGPQDLFPGEKMTVSAAIIKAGGFVQFANERKVKVTRKGRGGTDNSIVDVKAVLEDGNLSQDREVQDGDLIFVPRRLFNY
jgi:polysaccharide export outer membrane protein